MYKVCIKIQNNSLANLLYTTCENNKMFYFQQFFYLNLS